MRPVISIFLVLLLLIIFGPIAIGLLLNFFGEHLVKLSIFIFFILISCIAYAANRNSQAIHPLVSLASHLSQKNSHVIDEVKLFVRDKNEYFVKHKQTLLNNRFIDSEDELTAEVVLVDALIEQESLVYVDWKQDPDDVLGQLVKLSKGRLKKSNTFEELANHYANTEYGIAEFFDEKGDWPSIFVCARDVGLNLMAVNEGSDQYALFFIEDSEKEKITQAFKDADVTLYRFRADEM